MRARSIRRLCLCTATALTMFAMSAFAAAPATHPQGETARSLYNASGVRSGNGLTTLVSCTNRGNVPGTIGITLYQFEGTSICTSSYSNVNPGETRSIAADTVASMSAAECGLSTQVLDQGHVEIWGMPSQTLRWNCSVHLIASASDPPIAMTRLSLFTATGAPVGDVIFADGFEP
jgi:hypothetical protein